MPTPDPTPPLIAVRDMLRDAGELLADYAETHPSPEADRAHQKIVEALEAVRSIGHDLHWKD